MNTMYRIIILLIVALLTACGKPEVSNDSMWVAKCEKIHGDLQACYGPGWSAGVPQSEENYDFYEISIERVHSSGSSVMFGKSFRVSEVKKEVLDRFANNVIQIDSEEKSISFNIANQPLVVSYENYSASNK